MKESRGSPGRKEKGPRSKRTRAAGARMDGIGAGGHVPAAAAFGIPAEGELDQGAAGGAMEIGAGVVAGAHHVVDLELFDVGLAAIDADLPAALKDFAAAAQHGE